MKSRFFPYLFSLTLLAACMPSANQQQNDDEQAGESTLLADRVQTAEPDLPLEQPAALPTRPEQILHRDHYTVSYNAETMQPNWVAWRLTKAHTYGNSPRPQNAFREDEEVPRPRATLADYHSRKWSRGHMCPAGDNKWDSEAMYETFLLTNICPQNFDMNDGVWNDIEMTCRKWARKYGEVFIVCGPLFTKSTHETIGPNHIPVPEAFFKVVLAMGDTPKAIGFLCRNAAITGTENQYVQSVDEVERITGMDFFPALNDDIEETIESRAHWKDW